MKVYIQKHEGLFLDDLFFTADMGFRKLGADIKYFEDIDTVPFSKDIVVVAFIEDSIKYFKDNNIEIPKPLNIPKELWKDEYLLRYIYIDSFQALKETAWQDLPKFVKPVDQVKQFSSGILTNPYTIDLSIGILPDETNIMVSSIVDFISEYRCFIYKQEIVGIKHYTGDFNKFIDPSIVKLMVNQYSNAPISYSLDVGLMIEPNTGLESTTLVECNDFWSIGSYGLDAVIYAKMLRDRWFQIIR